MDNGPANALTLDVTNTPGTPTPFQILGYSGAFDAVYYLKTNPDLKNLGTGALRHYHQHGWQEGRKPNPFFDPTWYRQQNPDVLGDPLLHYILQGESQGRKPISWFDPVWYASTYPVPQGMLALAHYLLNKHQKTIRPIAEFDPEFYLKTYPDIASAGVDPLEHYMVQGFRESRRPFEGFDPLYYKKNYLRHAPDSNPLLHYLGHRYRDGIHTAHPENEVTVFREVRRRSAPGPFFEALQPLPDSAVRRARVLAYYLPQFHAIPENNTWWGEGFTEWTNTSRALPRFADHYQPRIPRDLGHYTLNSPDLLEKQARMAKAAGIEGFVFYFYWFNRQRLLDGPLEMLLANPQIDLPFCLMWANENWSRRWDGSDDDLLISQHYDPKDDDALIDCFARHMKDARYITVQGRPLLMIYRPGTIPTPRDTIARWRNLFHKRHNLNPIFIMGQAFNDENPTEFGIDGAIEFPPHKITAGCTLLNDSVKLLDDDFRGQIYDYSEIVEKALQQPPAPFPLIRTAAPSWDNDARRQGKGLVMHGSTPELYRRWLSGLVDQARQTPFFGDPIVCINAWNEWAEGAYLEPDLHFGSAYLNATAQATTGFENTTPTARLLLIGHDAFPAGAQKLLLELGRTLKHTFGADIRFILLEGGAMLDAYRQVAPTEILSPGAEESANRLNTLHAHGFHTAILNSGASAPMAPLLKDAGLTFTFLIHELPALLKSRNLEASTRHATQLAHTTIVPAQTVATRLDITADILPQGLYNPITFSPESRLRLRKQLNLSPTDRLIIGIGHADLRKGFDLFLQLWHTLTRQPQNTSQTHCLWLGSINPSLRDGLGDDLECALSSSTFHMPGQNENVTDWLSAADVFALTSREDPYPSVVLEALASGLPCMAFENSGGIPPLLHHLNTTHSTQNAILPFADVSAMAASALTCATHSLNTPPQTRLTLGEHLKTTFHFETYVETLLYKACPTLPRISVVVPSHNYARYLGGRLSSIFTQTLPILEIIVLDDASTDDSPIVARQIAREWNRKIRLIESRTCSGSVFQQWQKAASIAKGDWIWIAEADDLCEPRFLESLFQALQHHPKAVMAFSNSRTITETGAPLSPSYQDYYTETVGNILNHDGYFDGKTFLETCLSERNLILNASAVVFKRTALKKALTRCQKDLATLTVAGDWRLYLEILSQKEAGIVYINTPLNSHRRHTASTTASLAREKHFAEICFMHDTIGKNLPLPDASLARQTLYQQKIRAYFHLSPPEETPVTTL